MSNAWSDITALENSRQHNGNVYNDFSKHYPLKQRKSDETLREDERNRALLKAAAEGQTVRVRKLIEKGADVDFREGKDGLTALHHAVLSGFEDVVDELMSHGADINAVSSEFGSPICFAALKARRNIFQTLLDHRALLEAGTDFGSLAHAACCGGDKSIIESLETKGVSFEESRKINANRMAEIRSSDILMLLKQFNVRIWMDCLPIHVAAFFGHTEVVELLLAFGSSVRSIYSEISAIGQSEDWKTEAGYTALIAAAYSGNIDIVKLLIDVGVDVNAKTASSRASALWIAAGLGRAHLVPLLIDSRSSEAFESHGTSPTALAVLLRQVANAEKLLAQQKTRHRSEKLTLKNREAELLQQINTLQAASEEDKKIYKLHVADITSLDQGALAAKDRQIAAQDEAMEKLAANHEKEIEARDATIISKENLLIKARADFKNEQGQHNADLAQMRQYQGDLNREIGRMRAKVKELELGAKEWATHLEGVKSQSRVECLALEGRSKSEIAKMQQTHDAAIKQKDEERDTIISEQTAKVIFEKEAADAKHKQELEDLKNRHQAMIDDIHNTYAQKIAELNRTHEIALAQRDQHRTIDTDLSSNTRDLTKEHSQEHKDLKISAPAPASYLSSPTGSAYPGKEKEEGEGQDGAEQTRPSQATTAPKKREKTKRSVFERYREKAMANDSFLRQLSDPSSMKSFEQ